MAIGEPWPVSPFQNFLTWSGSGSDAIWLTPIYPRRCRDGGVTTNHRLTSLSNSFFPDLGDLRAWGLLLEQAHIHAIRVILDLVLNHNQRFAPWYSVAPSWAPPGGGVKAAQSVFFTRLARRTEGLCRCRRCLFPPLRSLCEAGRNEWRWPVLTCIRFLSLRHQPISTTPIPSAGGDAA